MARHKRKSLQIGDVVLVPIDDRESAVAQVVAKYKSSEYYFTVLNRTVPLGASVAPEPGDEPVLIGLTFDVLVENGGWLVVDNMAVLSTHAPLPAYLISTLPTGTVKPQFFVEDYTGTRQKPASPKDEGCFPYRLTVSPAMFEKAVKAHFGRSPWEERFDALRPPEMSQQSIGVFGSLPL